jgi:pimeloyl-ACP methyl ester carboxylesterase
MRPIRSPIMPGGANSPSAGYQIPLTLVALPKKSAPDSFEVRLADPERIESVRIAKRDFPVAMDLEAALDATRATGPRLLDGIGCLLRPDRKNARLTFLQPYDPAKIPVVLIHGWISTPRMWAPVVKGLLADPEIRQRYQFWFFYYPTGHPVPLSALQLRETLDEAILRHHVRRPLILIGHSMGGILARAQVSRLTLADAERMLPNVSRLPISSKVRRCLVFEPRNNVVSRVVFICTPHRGSRIASSSIAGIGIRLIQLPSWIAEEMADFASLAFAGRIGRLPTSIHGLSPYSRFLEALSRTLPSSPSHSIIGRRDGVLPFSSAHLESAVSEVFVPAGHGGFAHPLAIQEMKRILRDDKE